MLSIILPAYNEEKNIFKIINALDDLMNKEIISYEIIVVDDGSSDGTWDIISSMHKQNKNLHGVKFSRNFGKEAAILAGLTHSKGECCVVMDCDLQHPLKTVVEMYRLWENGFEIVEGIKSSRAKEAGVYKLCAKIFYVFISKAIKIDMKNASDFKLLDRKVVRSLLTFPEQKIFFRALSSWVGYKKTTVEFETKERQHGESKWNYRLLTGYAISNITSFTTLPMQIVTMLGVIFLIFASIMSIHTLVSYFSGNSLQGFTTVILLILLTGGILMTSLGIIGYYIARIYDEGRHRPRYIVSEFK